MNSPKRKLCQRGLALLPIAILLSALPSCGGTTGTDGSQSGGSLASGGQVTGTGGASPSGGTSASGAMPGSGGVSPSGGASPSGGTPGSGGAGGNGATGGAQATGGTANGGGSQGGGGSPPADCLLPADTGPCDGALMRLAFDPGTGLCLPFSYGGCEGNANRFETLEACDAACRNGSPTPMDSCTTPLNCQLASFACCGPCEPIELSQLEAFDQRFIWVKDQQQQLECAGIACGACAEGDRVSQNYGVACENNTCVGFDVRARADLSACEIDADCRLRQGLSCCEGCGGDDWVAVTTTGTGLADVLCGSARPPCPACDGMEPANLAARCVDKTCQVVQL